MRRLPFEFAVSHLHVQLHRSRPILWNIVTLEVPPCEFELCLNSCTISVSFVNEIVEAASAFPALEARWSEATTDARNDVSIEHEGYDEP